MEVRISELDTLFQRLYEDNIIGKLTDERFMKMSKNYETEQKYLEIELLKLRKELEQEDTQASNVNQFISRVRKYTNIKELTPEIVHEFIDKIVVHEADKSTGRRLQEIEIVYNFVGLSEKSKITLHKGKAV